MISHLEPHTPLVAFTYYTSMKALCAVAQSFETVSELPDGVRFVEIMALGWSR